MAAYLSLLRGINVSGQKKILMTDLRRLYEDAGLTDVATYIQSGNVVFTYKPKTTNETLAGIIAKAIFKKYGFEVAVIIRTAEQLRSIVSKNPFAGKKGVDAERLYVTFLAQTPENARVQLIKPADYLPEKFAITGQDIYLHCPLGYGKAKLNNSFFENKLKMVATTRNWRTVNELLSMMNDMKS